MIRSVEALHYRSLRSVHQELDRFHVLVGPNASGKTTFFDVVRLLGDLVGGGLDAAIGARTDNLRDLVWLRQGDRFELAVELDIPEGAPHGPDYDACRYEVAIGADPTTHENAILAERLLLLPPAPPRPRQRALFPEWYPERAVLQPVHAKGMRTVVNKTPGGNDTFHGETGRGWVHAFRLGPRRSALGNLPRTSPSSPWPRSSSARSTRASRP